MLDFLPHGKPADRKAEPIAQGIGDRYLNLLEVVLREDVEIKPKDKIYIGKEKRAHVKYIKGKINYKDLTSFAKSILEDVIKELVEKEEKRFVEFFNRARPITTRLHSLELLPGIGKKHMWDIIEARKRKKFDSFKDLQNRVAMLPDPKKMIIKRIIAELEGKDRYQIFVGSSIV